MDFFKELGEEVADFFEDFIEFFFKKEEIHHHPDRKVNVSGHIQIVKPAYVFAERRDHLLRIVFGASIFVSAFTATFVGFVRLSALLEFLIMSFSGRGLMIIIGLSYFLLGVWKLINLDKK